MKPVLTDIINQAVNPDMIGMLLLKLAPHNAQALTDIPVPEPDTLAV